MKRIWMFIAMVFIIATASIPETGWAQSGNETTTISTKILPDSLRANVNSIWIDSNGDILVATAHLGLMQTTDDGRNWKQILNNLDWWSRYSYAVTRELKDNALLVGTANGVFRSSDNGITWSQPLIPPPYSTWKYGAGVESDFLIKKDGSVISGITHGIIESKDGGKTWETIFHDGHSDNLGLGIAALTINPRTNAIFAGTIYFPGTADTEKPGILRSTDDGKTWQKTNNGLGDLHILSVACDDSGIFYAGTEKKGLYRSIDNGDSWTKVLGIGEKKKEARKILVIRPDLVFVGFGWNGIGDGGVFKYDGKSWTQVVPDSVYSIMSLAVKGMSLLVGTTNSLYRVDGVIDPVTKVEETPGIPSSFRLEQNYPNPFNPSTTIQFSLPSRTNVNLTIYNMLGQVAETIVSGELNAGTHRHVWNAEKYPSGVYFYQLKAGAFTETKRMLLVK